jgi:3-hydroxymyristoyl/3-hydroxydecanoyl-(acyl carrier protein) dehydratase
MKCPFRLTARGSGEDGHRFAVAVPEECSLFTGHFPGKPILPGIAHLALAQWALGEIMGKEVGLAAVPSLKLRRPVAPGDLLELRIGIPGKEGVARFEVRSEGATASQGVVQVWTGPAPADGDFGDAEGFAAAGFAPPEALLPHESPALLLRAVAEVAEGGIVAIAEISPSHPLVTGSRFPSFLTLEAAAQAAAALEALGRRQAPSPRIGYLVGIRDARFTLPSLPAGRRLRVAARLQGGAFPLSVYAVTIGESGHEVAAGTLSTFLLANS